MNAVTAVVGVFHLQGSSWDRIRRKFYIHDKEPPRLKAEVRPTDIETFRSPTDRLPLPTQASPHAIGSSTANSSSTKPSSASDAGLASTLLTSASGESKVGTVASSAARFVAFSHNTQKLTALAPNQAMQVSLSSGEGDVITVSPIMTCSGVSFAPVGLMAMMNGGAAILSCVSDPDSSDSTAEVGESLAAGAHHASGASGASGTIRFSMDVRGCGELLLYSSTAPTQVLVNNGAQQCSFDASTGRLVLNVPQVQGLLTTVVVLFPTTAQH